jgi:hypothetical protein
MHHWDGPGSVVGRALTDNLLILRVACSPRVSIIDADSVPQFII